MHAMSWIVQLMAASQGKTEGQVYSGPSSSVSPAVPNWCRRTGTFFGKPRSSVYVGSLVKLGPDISKERS